MLLLLFAGILIFTKCSGSGNSSNVDLESLEDTLDETVQSYFLEKYDANAEITYQHIAGRVFIGGYGSAKLYYLLHINVTKNSETVECVVHVYGRKTDGADELYVKKESYYGYVIKERMEKWLEGYVNKTSIDEYYTLFFTVKTILYPSEYDTNTSADEIIKSVSSIELARERPYLKLYIIIPQSEYEKHSDIQNEFSELESYVNEINAKLDVILIVYSDEDYYSKKSGDDSDFDTIISTKIIDRQY